MNSRAIYFLTLFSLSLGGLFASAQDQIPNQYQNQQFNQQPVAPSGPPDQNSLPDGGGAGSINREPNGADLPYPAEEMRNASPEENTSPEGRSSNMPVDQN